MTRKLPHVGLRLPDMAERSMPQQDGLSWTAPSERDQERIARIMIAAERAGAFVPPREPIRVVAEVGEPVREVEA